MSRSGVAAGQSDSYLQFLLQTSMQSIFDSMAAQASIVANLQTSGSDNSSQLSDINDQLSQINQKLLDPLTEHQLDTLTSLIDQVTQHFDQIQADLDSDIEALNERFDDPTTGILAALSTQSSNLDNLTSTTSQSIADLEATIESLQATVATIGTDSSVLERLDALESDKADADQLVTLNDDLSALHGQVNTVANYITAPLTGLEARVSVLEGSDAVTGFSSFYEDISNQITTINNRLTALESSLATTASQLSSTIASLDTLNTAMTASGTGLSSQFSSFSTSVNNSINILNGNVVDLSTNIVAVQNSLLTTNEDVYTMGTFNKFVSKYMGNFGKLIHRVGALKDNYVSVNFTSGTYYNLPLSTDVIWYNKTGDTDYDTTTSLVLSDKGTYSSVYQISVCPKNYATSIMEIVPEVSSYVIADISTLAYSLSGTLHLNLQNNNASGIQFQVYIAARQVNYADTTNYITSANFLTYVIKEYDYYQQSTDTVDFTVPIERPALDVYNMWRLAVFILPSSASQSGTIRASSRLELDFNMKFV